MLNTKDPNEYIKQYSEIKSIKTISIVDEENSLEADTLKDIIRKECDYVDSENSLEDALTSIAKENPNIHVKAFDVFKNNIKRLENSRKINKLDKESITKFITKFLNEKY